MPRKFTYTHHGPLRPRQWGFLNDELDQLYAAISGGGSTVTVTQANTFSLGDVVGISGGTWVKAQAGSVPALAMVASASASEFEIALPGQVLTWTSHGLTTGTKYFLSGTAGQVTATDPDPDSSRQLILVPTDANNVLLFIGETTP